MSQNEQQHLISMINQIAINTVSAGDTQATATLVAGHIQKFWPRRMKALLQEIVDQNGDALHPAALLAAKQLATTLGHHQRDTL